MIISIIKENYAKIHASLSSIVKLILIISIFYATYNHLWHILIANTFLLFLLFFPKILKTNYKVQIPREFELIFLVFIIITFFLGEIRGIIIQTFFGVAVGFIGFTIMLILFSNSKFKTNYLLIIMFSLSFSLSFGLMAEMLKYYLKLALAYSFSQNDYQYSMMNLTFVAAGTLLSSVIGLIYMKGYRMNILTFLVSRFKKTNPNFFIERSDSPEEVVSLVKRGEDEKLEFKSTLRINLHTGDSDKKIELSVLRTIVSFLNSEGGVLLIGVSDNGELIGIESDKFENNDRFNTHFTNLIKEKIGKEFIPFMSFKQVLIEGKNILKVECRKSQRPVFLKNEGQELFYVRAGAASVEVLGSKLVDYISYKFKDK